MEAIKKDYRSAKLSPRQKALCEYAEKLTLYPSKMTLQDLDMLRSAGLTDSDILDAVEVISLFNYFNRLADALGIDLEPWMRPR